MTSIVLTLFGGLEIAHLPVTRVHHTALPRASRSFQSCSDARFVPKSFFVRRHLTKSHSDIVLLPSCGLHGATQGRLGALMRPCRKWHLIGKKQYESAPFSFHYVKVFQSRSDDRFLPKCVFCTTSSIESFVHNRIVSTLVAARTMSQPSRGRPQKIKLCDVIEREPPF